MNRIGIRREFYTVPSGLYFSREKPIKSVKYLDEEKKMQA